MKVTFETADIALAASILKMLAGGGAEVSVSTPSTPAGGDITPSGGNTALAQAAPADTGDRIPPTPAVATLIEDELGKGYDWTQIEPTGKGGKLTQGDVKKHAKTIGEQKQIEAQGGATKEDATAALQKLVGAKGMDAAREVLAELGAARLTELDSSKFGDLVAAVEAALS